MYVSILNPAVRQTTFDQYPVETQTKDKEKDESLEKDEIKKRQNKRERERDRAWRNNALLPSPKHRPKHQMTQHERRKRRKKKRYKLHVHSAPQSQLDVINTPPPLFLTILLNDPIGHFLAAGHKTAYLRCQLPQPG